MHPAYLGGKGGFMGLLYIELRDLYVCIYRNGKPFIPQRSNFWIREKHHDQLPFSFCPFLPFLSFLPFPHFSLFLPTKTHRPKGNNLSNIHIYTWNILSRTNNRFPGKKIYIPNPPWIPHNNHQNGPPRSPDPAPPERTQRTIPHRAEPNRTDTKTPASPRSGCE